MAEQKTENQNDLRKLQLVELDILKEFLRICKKHHLRYYALGGTLLGEIGRASCRERVFPVV